MGDSRIRIHISKELKLGVKGCGKTDVIKVCSSDTTIREVVEETASGEMISLLEMRKAALWDCTLHPPKNISEMPIRDFPKKQGMQSKTIFDAGWFPSGFLQLLPIGESPSKTSPNSYEDPQYNRLEDCRKIQDQSETRVQLMANKSNSLPLPSRVLASVSTRFAAEEELQEAETAAAKQERIKNKIMLRSKEEDRNRKLDARIQKLEEMTSSKNKNVSEQVQRMLIKSRATGKSSLKVQDRIYLRCVLDDGEESTCCREEYRYFSPQDTIGGILSTFPQNKDGWQIELLVRHIEATDGDDDAAACMYRRLPLLLRLYESISLGHISEFQQVVIRYYKTATDNATMAVEKSEKEVDDIAAKADNLVNAPLANAHHILQSETSPALSSKNSSKGVGLVDAVTCKLIFGSIQQMDGKSSKGVKKIAKKSSTADKVRQMKIKSKAKGAAKRIKRIEDRFFVELVTVRDVVATSVPVFVAKSDSFERLVRDHVSLSPTNLAFELYVLVPDESENLQRIEETSMTMKEAEQNGILHCFDRLIVRLIRP